MRFPFAAPRSYMYSPARLEPTNDIARTSSCSQILSTISCAPCTILRTPGGSPASLASSASFNAAPGTLSDGLIIMVLPAAHAIGNIHSGIMAGKLNAHTPATTPRGWRKLYVSMPRLTFPTVSPIIKFGMPQACSTTSSPRNTSPFASCKVLPCSAVMIAASSSMLSRMACCNLNITRARFEGVTSFHVSNAFLELATARSKSSRVQRGTLARISWVAGLTTSAVRPLTESTNLPSIKFFRTGGPADMSLDPSRASGRGRKRAACATGRRSLKACM
mmetsp:Transcript_597/g.2120  ORF Transcript_597/g.2120 Transcript_597/m.2120 type:complete len:277 (+) Transcript_597:1909-2739(+)